MDALARTKVTRFDLYFTYIITNQSIVLGSQVLFSLQRAGERRRVHHVGFPEFGIGPSHSKSRGFIGRRNDKEGSTQLIPMTIGMV